MIEISQEDFDRVLNYLEGYENSLYVLHDYLPDDLAEDGARTARRLNSFRAHLRAVKNFPKAE